MLKQAQSFKITLTDPQPPVGSLGHLSIFLWSLGLVMLPGLEHGIITSLFTLGVLILIYPLAVQRMARLRWLLILGSLFLVNVFFGVHEESINWVVFGLSVSFLAIQGGLQMVLRAAVILIAADGFSSSVNIMEVAGLLEHGGLHGLGFSIGVAANLLPNLRQSSLHAWHSLRMRGGLRSNWFRGIQLLLLTIFSNALRHAEEIVLAAEVRAYCPELGKKISIQIGILDWWLVFISGLSLAGVILFFR